MTSHHYKEDGWMLQQTAVVVMAQAPVSDSRVWCLGGRWQAGGVLSTAPVSATSQTALMNGPSDSLLHLGFTVSRSSEGPLAAERKPYATSHHTVPVNLHLKCQCREKTCMLAFCAFLPFHFCKAGTEHREKSENHDHSSSWEQSASNRNNGLLIRTHQ